MNRDLLASKANEKRKENLAFLKNPKAKTLIKQLYPLHEEVFKEVDCLQCAGCCKTISPRFRSPDIARAAKFLKMKETHFSAHFLRIDEDGDAVVKSSPCPFLGADNFCSIYEARPNDCRNYPYTDSDVFFKRPQTTLQNTYVCPAVYLMLEKIKKKAGF